MTKQFRVKVEGSNLWFHLFHSDEDLNDHTPIMEEDGDLAEIFAELDEGTPVYDLSQARDEAQAQFFSKKWTVSNGEIAFTKGDKKPRDVTNEIFGVAKEPMLACDDRAVFRNHSGELVAKTVSRGNGVEYHGSSDRATEVRVRHGI